METEDSLLRSQDSAIGPYPYLLHGAESFLKS